MSDGPYTTVTSQAWSTYLAISGRTQSYIDLLTPNYTDFLNGVKVMDGLSSALNGSNPPSQTVNSALGQITILEGAMNNIVGTFDKFKIMDADAVAQAATLDTGTVRKQYDQQEAADQDLLIDLNNVLYQCQLMTADAALGAST